MIPEVRRRVFETMEKGLGEDTDLPSRTFEIGIMTLIALNVVAVVLETVDAVGVPYRAWFYGFEVFSVAVFTLEYVLRLWSCTSVHRYRHAVLGRLRFAVTPMAIVDLAAILPFYIPALVGLDLRFLRAFRLLRVFKLARYSQSLRTLGAAVRAKKEQLGVALFVVFILLVVSASAMYCVEHEAQPEAFSSIPAAMWWAVATLTTVGYGDLYPVTVAGRCIGAVIALLGIATFALPAGIIAGGFTEELHRRAAGEREAAARGAVAASAGRRGRQTARGYRPEPIDTSNVELAPELSELADLLARNVHDIWAVQRLREGWEYGPQRSEIARTHPCLVPYEELPEGEKEYDLATVAGTLKAIHKLGYRVEKAG
jgi:voltage-gated potassium channel